MTAILFLAAPAQALRGIEPGSKCELLDQVEQNLGSKRRGSFPDDGPRRSIFFEGTHLGRDALISYRCREDVVLFQLIFIKLSDQYEAQLAFTEFKEALVTLYGQPRTDADEPTIAAMELILSNFHSEFGFDRSLPLFRFASWFVDKRLIHVMLRGEEQSWELVFQGP